MPPVYVVGYDDREAARTAARVTAALAARTGAEVLAVHVHPALPAPAAAVPGWSPPAAAEDALRAAARRTLATLDAPGVRTGLVAAASPAAGLHRTAEREHAALLAIGVTHRGPLGRLAPGSVAEHLLHGSPCPVLVVPERAQDGAIATIGVAYDDGPEARAALAAAGRLAQRLQARIVLLGVVPFPLMAADPMAPALAVQVADAARERLAAALQEAAGRLPAALDSEVRMFEGAVGSTLADAAGDGIDLLVCGSRGYGPLRGVLLGSVSRHLADHAPSPMLVVPRGVDVDLASGDALVGTAPASGHHA